MGVESASDLASFFDPDEFGTAFTYTPLVGSPITVNAIVDEGIIRVGFDSRLAESHTEITFSKTDITTPKRGDTLNDGSTTYTLVSPIEDDGTLATWLVST